MKIMGIDLGKARTGVCVSDLSGFLAGRSITIAEHNRQRLLEAVCREIQAEKPGRIVVGLALNMNGTEGARAQHAKEFGAMLAERVGDIPIVFFDERCSTMAAHQIMNFTDTRGKKRKEAVDTLSAQIILQNYLDSHR